MVNESEGFISLSGRHNEIRVRGVPIFEGLLVAAQLKEVVLFSYVLNRSAVNRAVSVVEVCFVEIGLTTNAIKTFVGLKINVSVVITGLQQFLHRRVVTLLTRSNEIIIRDF